jgi:hypothetical protein
MGHIGMVITIGSVEISLTIRENLTERGNITEKHNGRRKL